MDKLENSLLFISKGAFIDGGNLWLLTETTDILMCFDLATMKLKKYYVVPGDEWNQYAHLILLKGDRGIYLLPYMGDDIYLFDESEKLKKLPIACECYKNGVGKFLIAGAWKGRVAFVGHGVTKIIFYDEVSGGVEYYCQYIDTIQKAGYDISKPLFDEGYCQVENELFIPIDRTNAILKVDICGKRHELYQLHKENLRLRTIDCYKKDGKKKFLLTTYDDESLVWSLEEGIELFQKRNVLNGSGDKFYLRAYRINDKEYYIAAKERKVFVDKAREEAVIKFDYEKIGAFTELQYVQFEAVFNSGNDIYFQVRSDGQLFKIDTIENKIHRLNFNVDKAEKEKIISEVCGIRKYVRHVKESNVLDLELFLKIFVEKGNSNNMLETNHVGVLKIKDDDKWRKALLY